MKAVDVMRFKSIVSFDMPGIQKNMLRDHGIRWVYHEGNEDELVVCKMR